MKIFIYGQDIKAQNTEYVQQVFDKLQQERIYVSVYGAFHDLIKDIVRVEAAVETWSQAEDLDRENPDFLLTLGGDGTILSAIRFVYGNRTPILGINMGRLGFLASIEKKRIDEAIDHLKRGMYRLEERQTLQLESNHPLFGDHKIALNDFTLHKRDTSAMVTIHTYINGDFLNSYWADGIIVATPTGSTGYSLSCGGPIVFPNSGNFVITPVAPHNLNVRPIVISDSSVISFEIEGRSENFLCTLDSRYETITATHQIAVRKGDASIRLVQLNNHTFLKTIHDKLTWGIDSRN